MSTCDALLAWFTANGGQFSPDFQLTDNPTSGIHVRARKTLSTGACLGKAHICTCPPILSLSYLNIKEPKTLPQGAPPLKYTTSLLAPLVDSIAPHVLSRFVLIEQYLLGKESFWYPYIRNLPTLDALNTPIFFSEEDELWLRDTNLLHATTVRRELYRNEWQNVCAAFRSKDIEPTKFTWDLYKWAATIFTSRAFDSSKFYDFPDSFSILWPVIDSLNHDHAARADWDYRGDDSFSLYTNDSIEAGVEIFNNYGPKGNEELLMGYGFCIPDNPCDQVAVRLQIPGSLSPETLRRPDMNPYQLDKITPDEVIYIRSSACRFGRYRNAVPYLQGIPPLMVQFALQNYLRNLQTPLETLSKPVGRIHFGVLRGILQPVQMKLLKMMASTPPSEPLNEKQRYAKLCRDGQTSTLHDVHKELLKPLNDIVLLHHLRSPFSPPPKPAIISSTEAIATLRHESNSACEEFLDGVSSFVNARDPTAIRSEDCEDMVWMLWLSFTSAWRHRQVQVQVAATTTSSIINSWHLDLESFYGIPSNFSVDDQAETLQHIQKIAFGAVESDPSAGTWQELLQKPYYMSWAAKVVSLEVWQQVDPDESTQIMWMMYMRRMGEPEEWI